MGPYRQLSRARSLAQQRGDQNRGHFTTERIYRFTDFGVIAPQASAFQEMQLSGHLTRFVRLVAARGAYRAIQEGLPMTGLELSALLLNLTCNGSENFIVSQTTTAGGVEIANFAEFDGLFGPQAPQSPFVATSLFPRVESLALSPWYWWAAPPRLRTQDVLRATIFNNLPGPPSPPIGITPFLELRIVDDRFWREAYGT